jgi:uncharacterized protein
MAEKIKFRPHHFMCTLGFRGKGYSADFVRNYKKIVQQLNNDDQTQIEVVEFMDSICAPCPNKIDEIICKSQDKISRLDAAHAAALSLKVGDVFTWSEAKERIKKHMSIEKFHIACQGCSWKEYGVCQKALEELKG